MPPPAALKGAPRQNSLATRICWAGPPWLSEAWAGALVEEQGGGLCKSTGSPRNSLGYTGLGSSSLSSLETRTQLPHLSISIRVPGTGLSTLYACAHACLVTAQRRAPLNQRRNLPAVTQPVSGGPRMALRAVLETRLSGTLLDYLRAQHSLLALTGGPLRGPRSPHCLPSGNPQ